MQKPVMTGQPGNDRSDYLNKISAKTLILSEQLLPTSRFANQTNRRCCHTE